MRQITYIFSLAFMLNCFFLALPSLASERPMTILKENDLKEIFEDFIFADTPLSVKDLSIINFSSRPESIELPAGDIEPKIISRSNTRQLGRETIFAAILVDGKEQAEVKLRGDLQLLGSVVTTVNPLKTNSIISPEDIKITRRDISMLGEDIITSSDLAVGKQLKINLRPGSIIYKKDLKAPQLVKRGDVVSILAESGFLKITVPGRVQDPGAQGETIRVKNLMSRKEIFAKVISSEQVQVEF